MNWHYDNIINIMIMKYDLAVQPGSSAKNKTAGWRDQRPVFDKEKCIGCGQCAQVCPEGVCFPSGKKNKQGKIYYDCDLDFCKGCGLCAEVCPVKAIKMVPEKK